MKYSKNYIKIKNKYIENKNNYEKREIQKIWKYIKNNEILKKIWKHKKL